MEGPRRPRLVLHFDINGTVFVADPVSGVGPAQAVNIYLAGAVWGSLVGGAWEWSEATLAGRLTTRCPEEGRVSYYKHLEEAMAHQPRHEFKAALGRFVESPDGAVVRDVFGRIMKAMESDPVQAPPFAFQEDGRWYHYVLPSFWHLLSSLQEEGREFAVVLRTYGTDGRSVSEAIGAFAEGRHPMFPAGCPAARPAERPAAVLQRDGDGMRLDFEADGQEDATGSLSSEEDVFLYLSRLEGTLAIRDDYEFWKAGGFSAGCGKPLWVPSGPRAHEVHHILLDDNIRPWTDGSIVDPRFVRLGGEERGAALGGPCPQDAAERLGCLVPVATERSILEPDYFVRAVRECEERWAAADHGG